MPLSTVLIVTGFSKNDKTNKILSLLFCDVAGWSGLILGVKLGIYHIQGPQIIAWQESRSARLLHPRKKTGKFKWVSTSVSFHPQISLLRYDMIIMSLMRDHLC